MGLNACSRFIRIRTQETNSICSPPSRGQVLQIIQPNGHADRSARPCSCCCCLWVFRVVSRDAEQDFQVQRFVVISDLSWGAGTGLLIRRTQLLDRCRGLTLTDRSTGLKRASSGVARDNRNQSSWSELKNRRVALADAFCLNSLEVAIR